MSFLNSLKTVLGKEFGSVADVGSTGDCTGFIDTGSYSLNALVSGSLYGGFPSNKITGLAGDPATGKTFYMLQTVKSFIDAHPENEAVIFDSESAIAESDLVSRGIDTSRVAVDNVATIEEFRTKSAKVLDAYGESRKKFETPRLLLALDSLGNLSSNKEIADVTSGAETRDMTKAQLLKGAFRVLTIKCGKLNVPMIVNNHVYASIGGNTHEKTIAGGSGLLYAASTILSLSKAQVKTDEGIVGAVITVKTAKARLTKERQLVKTLLNFDVGLDRWYGLVEMAEDAGIFIKIGTKYKVAEGVLRFESAIIKNPEKYFTPEVMEKLEVWVGKRFRYGQGDEIPSDDEAEITQEKEDHIVSLLAGDIPPVVYATHSG